MSSRGISEILLPAHVKPKNDELLSSWLVRLSAAHGLKPYPFASTIYSEVHAWELRDVDRARDSGFLNTLANKTATDVERIINTTLTSYEGWLFESHLQHGTTAWIMPRGAMKHLKHKYFGLQYCPLCLSEDKQAYFRREWRLAFNVLCTKHKILILDRCPKCGEAINFYINISRDSYVDSDRLTVCHNCHSDYRNIKVDSLQQVDTSEVDFHKHLLTTLRQGSVSLTDNSKLHSLLYFEGLRHMAFALTKSHPYIDNLLEQATRYYGLINLRTTLAKRLPFEQLDVRTRRSALLIIQRLLGEWPEEFINFNGSNKLDWSVWIRERKSTPFWLWSIINLNVRRHAYTPSEQEITSILDHLDKSGRQLSSSELCKYLNPHIVPVIMRQRGLTKSAIRPTHLRRKAIKWVLEGRSHTDVAKLISVSRSTVSIWIKAHNATLS